MTEETPVIVRAKEIAAMAGLAKTHFLNADARRVNRSLGDATGLTGFGFHVIEVEPGAWTTEHHVHHHEDECVYVLEGEGLLRLSTEAGDEEHPIAAGDFIAHRKGGAAHSIRATGATPLRCIVVGERLPHDVADYPDKGKRIYRNRGLPWDLVDHAAIERPVAGAK